MSFSPIQTHEQTKFKTTQETVPLFHTDKDPSSINSKIIGKAALFFRNDFNGKTNESFLLEYPDVAVTYVVSKNGFFRFNRTTNACNKIATKSFVERNAGLQSIINSCQLLEGQFYRLNEKEMTGIEEYTKVSFQLRGLVKTELYEDPYNAVYRIAQNLISRDTLLDLESISLKASSSQFILALLAPPINAIDLSHLVYWPELTQIQQDNFKVMVDMNTVHKNTIFVDLMRKNTAGKTPVEIARYFETYCETFFNDSVLAEKWKAFADGKID